MNLKSRLAFLYSLSVFIILLASAFTIFLFAENFRKKEFVKQLVIEATESYQLYFKLNRTNAEVEQELNENNSVSITGTSIFVYNSNLRAIYATPGSSVPRIPTRYFSRAKTKEPYPFKIQEKEAVLLVKNHAGKAYYIAATASDIAGRRKIENLKIILVCSVIGGMVLSGFLAFFYVEHAIRPLEDLKVRMEQIDEKNLKNRIVIPESNDEIRQIANKFNAMLDRLEHAFNQRKNFVQHASHELRTPLANMLSQTEAALSKTLTAEQYRNTLLSLKEDQQDMIDLTNSLLILSRYEKVEEIIDPSQIRIDELIYQTAEVINQSYPSTLVNIDFESIPEDENALLFKGDEALLRSAIKNLVKNAVMFSEDLRVKISIDAGEKYIVLKFENFGKQLNSDEQSRLFIPFFRGENANIKKGHGLGLSIVDRIVKIHKGKITYDALPDNINRFTVQLPTATA